MQASARLSSSAASRRVIAGVSSTITRPCYRTWRGKAHAAPLSAQEEPKSQKRISKDERRVMIEEFVEVYKTSNDGNFPTIRAVRQHVGGSHYRVREILQEVKYNHTKLPLDKSKAAQPHETAECAEQSRLEEDNGSNSFNRQSFKGKQAVDDTLLSQKDSATGTITIEKTGLKKTPDSSHYDGETEAAKKVLYTADIFENANDSTVSGQTEIDSMKTEASISLGLETKSDPGNHQGETEANKLHLNKTEKFQNAIEPTVSSDIKEDVDNALLSQKDSATGTVIMEKTGTQRSLELKTKPGSSHYNGETEAGDQVFYTRDIFKNANDSTVLSQTEIDSIKTEASISLGLETKSEPGNHQGKTEANKLHLSNTENFQNASEPTVSSDQTESDKVIKANAADREENPEFEHQASTKTSLLGSLKSFASGIRSFWKNL